LEAGVAQSVEQLIRNEKVEGSIPFSGTIFLCGQALFKRTSLASVLRLWRQNRVDSGLEATSLSTSVRWGEMIWSTFAWISWIFSVYFTFCVQFPHICSETYAMAHRMCVGGRIKFQKRLEMNAVSGTGNGVVEVVSPYVTKTLYSDPSITIPAAPSITIDESTQTTSYVMMTAEEMAELDYRTALKHREIPIAEADAALTSIEASIERVQKDIDQTRPTLKNATWDFSLEDDRLKVSGNVSSRDKAWLERKLNADVGLLAAVNSYMHAAVGYLETTPDNMAYHAVNGFTKSVLSYDFKDVQSQMKGNVGFRDLLSNVNNSYRDATGRQQRDPGSYRGADSLEFLASRLVPSVNV
jgi:hypothetical protein